MTSRSKFAAIVATYMGVLLAILAAFVWVFVTNIMAGT